MNILKSMGRALMFPLKVLHRTFDMRDILLFGGIAMLGYGLYLRWGQWLAFMVCGVLLMAVGYMMKDI